MVILAGAVVTPCLPPPGHRCSRRCHTRGRRRRPPEDLEPLVGAGLEGRDHGLLGSGAGIPLHGHVGGHGVGADDDLGVLQVVHRGGIDGLDVAAPKLKSWTPVIEVPRVTFWRLPLVKVL